MTGYRLPVLIAALIASCTAFGASDNNATINNSGADSHCAHVDLLLLVAGCLVESDVAVVTGTGIVDRGVVI